MLMNTQVGNIPSTSLGDGTQPFLLAGQSGEAVVTELHGKWYTAAKRGNVYISHTLVAGTTIPVNASGLVSTYAFWNPAGSGKNCELIRYDMGLSGTTTAVIASVALVFQAAVGSTIAVPGSLTALTAVNGLLGAGGVPVATAYSALTHVGTPTRLMSMALSFGTTGASPGPVQSSYVFDGAIIVPPGCIVSVTSQSAAQTQPVMQGFTWAEWAV